MGPAAWWFLGSANSMVLMMISDDRDCMAVINSHPVMLLTHSDGIALRLQECQGSPLPFDNEQVLFFHVFHHCMTSVNDCKWTTPIMRYQSTSSEAGKRRNALVSGTFLEQSSTAATDSQQRRGLQRKSHRIPKQGKVQWFHLFSILLLPEQGLDDFILEFLQLCYICLMVALGFEGSILVFMLIAVREVVCISCWSYSSFVLQCLAC